MNEEEKALFDQSLALFRDTLPALWWSLYQGAISSGFTKLEAMDLVKSYVLGTGAGKIYPPMSTDTDI